MKRLPISEKLLLDEVTLAGENVRKSAKGLSIGAFIKIIRIQLGMTQAILAKRAGVPQSTVSRVEKGDKGANIATLNKILEALYCDLVLAPVLRESIDFIRKKQARKKAEMHIRYLKGTMNLEKQQPDSKWVGELLKQEEERLLQGPGSKLWDEM